MQDLTPIGFVESAEKNTDRFKNADSAHTLKIQERQMFTTSPDVPNG